MLKTYVWNWKDGTEVSKALSLYLGSWSPRHCWEELHPYPCLSTGADSGTKAVCMAHYSFTFQKNIVTQTVLHAGSSTLSVGSITGLELVFDDVVVPILFFVIFVIIFLFICFVDGATSSHTQEFSWFCTQKLAGSGDHLGYQRSNPGWGKNPLHCAITLAPRVSFLNDFAFARFVHKHWYI